MSYSFFVFLFVFGKGRVQWGSGAGSLEGVVFGEITRDGYFLVVSLNVWGVVAIVRGVDSVIRCTYFFSFVILLFTGEGHLAVVVRDAKFVVIVMVVRSAWVVHRWG